PPPPPAASSPLEKATVEQLLAYAAENDLDPGSPPADRPRSGHRVADPGQNPSGGPTLNHSPPATPPSRP
ncbi:hypothetical protein ACWC5I_33735, partial [Kitasatospora sp. NPDC001574]